MGNPALEKIRKLLEKYAEVVEEGRVSKYNEEMTKKDFILPLFDALGWKTADSREVTAEEKISKKRVDYGFRINGIPQFFLEAKSLKEDLDNPKFFEQAVSYAWHKGCTWAVLTNFARVKILNAEWKARNYLQSHFMTLEHWEFVKRFEDLLLLSKASFEEDKLDELAERFGKKSKKESVDKQLLNDFTRFRTILSRNITKLNGAKNLSEEELDESVQRILDRLIFIRNCEDRELEPRNLISNYRQWTSRGRGQLVKSLREDFAYFDEQYNSKLFAKHLCDSLEIDNDILEEVIVGLYYTKDRSISYDFSMIDADVLGTIYEQYLGHILKKTKKRTKINESRLHRKEQGIYYTPTYIVEYIVKNTLGELLKRKKVHVEKIRVLDPACGSGSFLIKAFDVLNEYYEQTKDYQQTELDLKTGIPFTAKVKILANNIFGVDLDKQAVEIAQLNLLLKIAEKGHRLPLLEQSIKCGNSLIDDEKIAGPKAFKWEDNFKDIIENDGFDVVIGNPPYVRVDNLKKSDKKYWKTIFCSTQGKYDLYYLFIESAFRLLRNNGRCGFIVPNKFCAASSAKCLREIIVNNSDQCTIISVSHLPIFKDAANYPVLLLLKKGEKAKKIDMCSVSDQREFLNRDFVRYVISREDLTVLPSQIFPININQEQFDLVIKLLKKNKKLVSYMKLSEGLRIPTTFETRWGELKIVKQYQFNKWGPIAEGSYISKKDLEGVVSPNSRRYQCIFQDKIIVAEDALSITAVFDKEKHVPQGGVYFGVLKSNAIPIEYFLGLLNSRLLSFVYSTLFGGMHMGGGYLRYRSSFLEQLPIRFNSQHQELISSLVREIIILKARLHEIGEKITDEKSKIETAIEQKESQIDNFVYKIYELTENEQRIIE
jgi:type I restriction-modification system DNA methylase subunit